jgi:flagellar protein FlgJ
MTTSTSALNSLLGAAKSGQASAGQRAALTQAAKQFEAIFTRQLIGSMRQTGVGDDLTGSSAVDQFQELSDARTADTLADKGGLGIANLLLQQLDRAVAADPSSASTSAAGSASGSKAG